MTFDEAKAFICGVNPDRRDPVVRGIIASICGQAEALAAHLQRRRGVVADEAATPNPAVKGKWLVLTYEQMALIAEQAANRGAEKTLDELKRRRDDIAPDEAAPPNPAVKGGFISQEQADRLDRIEEGVARLVRDREGRRAANAERGRANYEKGDGNGDRERAAADMKRATERVRERVLAREREGKRAVALGFCRDVCKTFTPKSARKNALGGCADGYWPLTGADGKPIKPETLARRYRERYGAKPRP